MFESETFVVKEIFKKVSEITPRDVSSYAYTQRKILIFGSEMHLLGEKEYDVFQQCTTDTPWLWDSMGQPF